MRYTYTTTKEQWIEFQIFQAKRKFDRQKNRILHLVIALCLNLALVANIAVNALFNAVDPLQKTLLVFCVLVLFDWYTLPPLLFLPKRIRKKCRAYLDSHPDAFVEQQTVCEIKDGMLYLRESCGIESATPLRLIYEIAETPLSVVIYRRLHIAELVPKSVFATPDEKNRFISVLRGHEVRIPAAGSGQI